MTRRRTAIIVRMGRCWAYGQTQTREGAGDTDVYRCKDCERLPAGRGCASTQTAKRGRTIIADAHEP